MKVLVTGGAGFIGSHLVDALLVQGHQVTVIDNLTTGHPDFVHPRAKLIVEDITSKALAEIFTGERPEVVYHLAAQVDVQLSVQDPVFDAKENVLGTVNVLDACVRAGVRKVVYSSSAAVYGDPQYVGIDEAHPTTPKSNYGASKLAPEFYLGMYQNLHGLQYTVLCYANVYGPRQQPKGEGGVIPIFIAKMLAGEELFIFGSGEQTRDFIYVDDVVRANLAALNRAAGHRINIGTGVSTSVNELYERLAKLIGLKGRVIYKPVHPGDVLHSYMNIGKAREVLGWDAQVSLELGLVQTLAAWLAALAKQLR